MIIMKEDLIKFLEKDCEKLQQKMENALELNDFGTYKNLMRALADANDLIRRNEWKLKYSEYETDGHKEVAVWEQNHEGEIRNHKRWSQEKMIKTINVLDSAFDNYIKNNTKDGVCMIPITNAIRGVGKSTYMKNKANAVGNVYIGRNAVKCLSIKNYLGSCIFTQEAMTYKDNYEIISDAKEIYIDECVEFDALLIRKINPTCKIIAYKNMD